MNPRISAFGAAQSRRFAVVTVLAAGLCAASCRTQQPAVAAAPAQKPASNSGAVGCLGRVEPGTGVVRIAARSLSGQPSIVARLFTHEGDIVRAGEILGELDSVRQLLAAARQAEARTEVARRRLAQVQAGAKPSEVAAQEAEVEGRRLELDNATEEHRRHASLGDNVTASQIDALKLRVDSAQHALEAAKQRLAALTEVRPIDVELARAELDEAVRNETTARAEHEASILRSPIDGRVLKIYAWPSERVADDGVMELAPLAPMYVVAEVAESDIGRVNVGQRATISAEALAQPVQGHVEQIGAKVLQNQLVRADPVNFSDGRVVNVRIKVDDSQSVANLINLRVNVILLP
jgi:HlyD family secretion protein